MGLMETVLERAKANPQRVAFPEGQDETIMKAAAEAVQAGIAIAVLVGDEAELRALAEARGIATEVFEYSDTGNKNGIVMLIHSE